MKKGISLDGQFLRGFLIIFLAGTAIGFLVINLGEDFFYQRAGIISEYYLRQDKYQATDGRALLAEIAPKRLFWVLALSAAAVTDLALALMMIVILWAGAAGGIILGISILKFGWEGVFFAVGAMLPHVCFYAAGFYLLMQELFLWMDQRKRLGSFSIRKATKSFGLIFLGILTESFLNPWLLPWLIDVIL